MHRRRSHGGLDATTIWLWGLLWITPHKNFIEQNVISAMDVCNRAYVISQRKLLTMIPFTNAMSHECKQQIVVATISVHINI